MNRILSKIILTVQNLQMMSNLYENVFIVDFSLEEIQKIWLQMTSHLDENKLIEGLPPRRDTKERGLCLLGGL